MLSVLAPEAQRADGNGWWYRLAKGLVQHDAILPVFELVLPWRFIIQPALNCSRCNNCTVCYTINACTQLDVDAIGHLAAFALGEQSEGEKYRIDFGSKLYYGDRVRTRVWKGIK